MQRSEELKLLFEPVVEALGYVLWGIETSLQGKDPVIRLFIDSDDGIGVSACTEVSHHVGAILDVEDPISGEYRLEVSSPGIDRPLFTLEQFQKYQGHQLKLRLRRPFEDRRKFTGQLVKVDGDELVIQEGEYEYILPIQLIEKANLIA
ncbi:MAG: ribosome maturation factor RimP [Pseudomonadales bacterium]|nr:ribosome maturation factor RimP [Pseudomonadales bacterium]